MTMASRQFVYALLCKSMNIIIPQRWLPVAQKVMRLYLLAMIAIIFFWCLLHMSEKYDSLKMLYLCYPYVSNS